MRAIIILLAFGLLCALVLAWKSSEERPMRLLAMANVGVMSFALGIALAEYLR